MFGLHGRSLFIVPAVAVLLAGPASAQGYGNQGVYSEPLPPPPGQSRYNDQNSRAPTGAIPQDSRSGHYFPEQQCLRRRCRNVRPGPELPGWTILR